MSLDEFAPDVDLTAEPEVPEAVAETTEAPAQEEVKEPEPKPEKMVPLGALHESRMKEREWRDKAVRTERESQERFAKLEARLQAITNPPQEVPKFEEDPAGHLKHEVNAAREEVATLRQSAEQSRQSQEVRELERQITITTNAAEVTFQKEHPDYLQAVSHLQSIADKNLQMMGVEDPVARQEQIRKDAMAMSLKAIQMGKSPAEVAYQLATNYGYKQAVTTGEVVKKIATLQEGQKTSGMPSGGTKQTGLTLAALEQMDDDEFNKVLEDDTQWKKLIHQMQ